MRVKFEDRYGQKKFLNLVLKNLSCPSISAFDQFGFEIPYSTMKNYFSELRFLPKELFDNLCYLAKINPEDLKISFLDESWGKSKGGKKSKKKKRVRREKDLLSN